MAFKNFMFSEDDEEMTFLPHEPSPGFNCGSPFSSIKNKPTLLEGELLDSANPEQLVGNTADSRCLSAREEMLVIGSGSVAERMNDRKCRTKGSKKPRVKRKLAFLMQLNSVVDCHLMMSNVVVNNAVNRRAQELLKVVDQVKGECEVFKEKEKARDREFEELRLKCEAAMADFNNNLAFNVISQKIKSLSDDVKHH
ncbi:hypothetical protein Tco_1349055, partial [Tanacetum coccineum]